MKKIINILSLLFVSIAINAQGNRDSVFSRDVDIVRTYTPVVNDAGKINSLPIVEKPEIIDAKDIKYSTWSSPVPTKFDLQTLPAATLKRMSYPKTYREGYAKVGMGNYSSFLGDFYIPIVKTKDSRLDFQANHLSTFGRVRLDDDTKTRARNMRNAAQLSFKHNFYNVDFFSEINYDRRDFNYYGLDSILPDNYYQFADGSLMAGSDMTLPREAHTFFDIGLGIVSRQKLGGMKYSASLKYSPTRTRSGLTENHIQTKAFFATNWAQDEVGINFSLDNLFYNDPQPDGTLFANLNDETKSYSILGLSPHYAFERDNVYLKIGLKTYFSINKGKVFTASPDIITQISAVKDIFYIYGGLTGGMKINSMQTIFKENQYVRPDIHIEDTRTPLDAYAGVKIKLFNYLIFNAYAGYEFINNQYFYINQPVGLDNHYHNSFNYVIDEANLFKVGASLTYNWNDKLSALLKGKYNGWKLDEQSHAWHKPNWELDFDLTYKINDDIKVKANAYAAGKRYALGYDNTSVKLDPIFDLSLSGTYEFTSWLSFYLNLNNILAQNNQKWYGYNMHRFNAMAGAVFSF